MEKTIKRQLLLAVLRDAQGQRYYDGEIDGKDGPGTRAGTERFLEDYGFSESGADKDGGEKTGSFWDHIRYWSREEFRCRCGEYHEPYCDGFPVEPDQTLVELVDDLRHHFGRPGHRSSGIRCRQHNADQPDAAVNSRHLQGKALDFFIEDVSGAALLAAAQADKRCRYAYIIGGQYVHVDVE